MSSTSKEDVLPPKANHKPDRQAGNGTTTRMAGPFETELSLDGIFRTCVKIGDQTANGELEVAPSKAALGHYGNAIATAKLTVSIFKQLDKNMSPAVGDLLADVVGGHNADRFRTAIAAKHRQRQIAADQPEGAGGDKSDQG